MQVKDLGPIPRHRDLLREQAPAIACKHCKVGGIGLEFARVSAWRCNLCGPYKSSVICRGGRVTICCGSSVRRRAERRLRL